MDDTRKMFDAETLAALLQLKQEDWIVACKEIDILNSQLTQRNELIKELVGALKKCELISANGFDFCPICQYVDGADHSNNCILSHALKRAKEVMGDELN